MEIRFIKLGGNGLWEEDCIEKDNVIRLGYESDLHEQCLRGTPEDWELVRQRWNSGNDGVATRHMNQIKSFYETSEEDIWITFYKRRLYWCRAYKEVVELDDRSRIRKVIGEWSCLGGKPSNKTELSIESLDGQLSSVQAFRGTICGINPQLTDYILRRLEGVETQDVLNAKLALKELHLSVERLIKGLWWKDFELLIDLIFAKQGWQRNSILGGVEKDIDLDIYSPVTENRAFVQIKSSTNQDEFSRYQSIFESYGQFDEMYFIYHTANDSIKISESLKGSVKVWNIEKISQLTIQSGLTDWLIQKRS